MNLMAVLRRINRLFINNLLQFLIAFILFLLPGGGGKRFSKACQTSRLLSFRVLASIYFEYSDKIWQSQDLSDRQNELFITVTIKLSLRVKGGQLSG